jgi:hypothetical protein
MEPTNSVVQRARKVALATYADPDSVYSSNQDAMLASVDAAMRVLLDDLLAIRDIDPDMTPSDWEDFPEIAEHDWVRVEVEVERRAEAIDPTDDVYRQAYELLAGRASPNYA